jgi:hypothetical protein
MSNYQFTPMEDEGKEAWKSLRSQLFELKGFTQAMFQSVFHLLRKNLVMIFILPIILGGITFLWYRLSEPTYRASMTVSYVHLEKKIYADMIVKLNQSIKSDGIQGMPGFNSLFHEVNASLLDVLAINLKGEDLTSDLSVEHIPFDLVVEVNNLDGLDELEQALVQYLDSPVFVQERLAFNLKNAKSQIAFYTLQIKSMQNRLDEIDTVNNPEILEVLINQMNEARDKLAESEGQLMFNNNIEVLHGFQAASAQAIDHSKSRAKMAAILGLLLAFGIGVFRK